MSLSRRPGNARRVMAVGRNGAATGHGATEAGGQAAHRAMRRGGAMGTSRPTATGPYDNGTGKGAGDQAAHRGGEPPRATWRGGASREARRPSIAPYRNGTAPRDRTMRPHNGTAPLDCTMGHGNGANGNGTAPRGARGAGGEGSNGKRALRLAEATGKAHDPYC